VTLGEWLVVFSSILFVANAVLTALNWLYTEFWKSA
jgi:hypothetical protein